MREDLEFTQVKKIDISDMHNLIYNFYKEFPKGQEIAQEADLSDLKGKQINNVILAGMGGSAIGGNLAKDYLRDTLPVPLQVNRTYKVPNYVDENTLAFISSYSGNTEETLSALRDTLDKGANVICISSDGELYEKARQEDLPLLKLPGGYPPRAALGFSFIPFIVVLSRLNLIPDQSQAIQEATELLQEERRQLTAEVSFKENEAKKLAAHLHDNLTLIYTPTMHFKALGRRFRGQLEENAKMLAYSAAIPEMNHNELEGWNNLSIESNNLAAVMISDQGMHPKIKKRMELTAEFIEQKGAETFFVESKGDNLLSRIFSVVQIADFTSLYLATLNKENPTPVRTIEKFKKKLSKGSNKE